MNSSNLVLNRLDQSSNFNTSQQLLNDLVKDSIKEKDHKKDVDVSKQEEIKINYQVDDINQRAITNKKSTIIDISETPIEENVSQDWRLLCDENESLDNDNKFKLPNSLIKSTSSENFPDLTKYQINPHSLSTRHPEINHFMKILLLDWMNEVCAEFDLRRETYYLAYHFLNLYLDKSNNILK